jgi:UDP-N-acetylglucosamine/UDP-N-acetylgalactosamine diphosphorylase
VVQNNILYIANLLALEQWYKFVRTEFVSEDFPDHLLLGLQEKVSMGISERLIRLGQFAEKSQGSPGKPRYNNSEFIEKWPTLSRLMLSYDGTSETDKIRDGFLEKLQSAIGRWGIDYLAVIQNLDGDDAADGTRWLKGVVDDVTQTAYSVLPGFSFKIE